MNFDDLKNSVINNDYSRISELLSNDVDINLIDDVGKSVLFYAENYETVKFLLDNKSDINIIDNYENNILINFLSIYYYNKNSDNIFIVKLLINHFENIENVLNHKNKQGNDLLYYACMSYNNDIIKFITS